MQNEARTTRGYYLSDPYGSIGMRTNLGPRRQEFGQVLMNNSLVCVFINRREAAIALSHARARGIKVERVA